MYWYHWGTQKHKNQDKLIAWQGMILARLCSVCPNFSDNLPGYSAEELAEQERLQKLLGN